MKKKCKVVMLPTNEKAPIAKYSNSLYNTSKDKDYSACIYQHLYICSDEPIKESDWYLGNDALRKDDKPIYVVRQCNKITNGWIECNSNQGVGDNPDWSKKIIITTDKSIAIEHDVLSIFEHRGLTNHYPTEKIVLAHPSPEFIHKYVNEYNKGNIITDVMVEYETDLPITCTSEGKRLYPNIKVDKDNYATITKIKDSWTREELEPIMLKLCHDTADYIEKANEDTPEFNVYEWINNNLI